MFFHLIVTLMLLVMGVVEAELNYTTTPSDFVTVGESQVANMFLNLTGLTTPLIIEIVSSNENLFTLDETTFQVYPEYELFPNGSYSNHPKTSVIESISVPVRGVYFGIASMEFVVRGTSGLIDPSISIEPFTVKVVRNAGQIQTIFTYVLLVWLMISYITMGVKLEWEIILGKLKRPFGVVIGAVCQFIVMPGIAALLAKIMHLDATTAVGLIIVGSCPGGWLSNIFTLLLDCDLILSLTMTFCSTVIALGLMPFNLFIYATPYARGNSNISIPFAQIFIQLITLVVPLCIGTFVAHRYPRAAKWFRRLLKPLAAFLVIAGFAAGIYANYFAFSSPASIYLVAIIVPSIAALLGFFVAKMTCLSNRSAVTISIETGAQNSLMALSVIGLSFPQPESDLMARVPVLFTIFTFVILFMITGVSQVMKRFPGRFELPTEDEDDNDDEKRKRNDTKSEINHSEVDTNHAKSFQNNSTKQKVDISSRIHGVGPKQLYEKSKTKSHLPSLSSSMRIKFSHSGGQHRPPRTFHVDHAVSNDHGRNGPAGRRSMDGAHVNQAYSRDSDRSDDHTSKSVVSLSIINTSVIEARNESARQVYL